MAKYLTIPSEDGTKHYYEIKFNEYRKIKRIFIDNVCIIEVYKFHDHCYSMKAFSYKDKNIFCVDKVNTKKKIIEQIELFLKGHIYPYFEAREETVSRDTMNARQKL